MANSPFFRGLHANRLFSVPKNTFGQTHKLSPNSISCCLGINQGLTLNTPQKSTDIKRTEMMEESLIDGRQILGEGNKGSLSCLPECGDHEPAKPAVLAAL